MQVLVGFDSRGMITFFPERSLPPFGLIVFLAARPAITACSAESRAGLCPSQKMNMIGRHHIVEEREAEALLGFEHPARVTASVPRTLQQECLLVAAVSEVQT